MKRWRLKALLFVLVVASVAAGAGWWWFRTNILDSLPTDLSRFRDWRPPLGCRITDAAGRQIDEFHLERRIWVDLDALPAHVPQAFVSAEDRRFFRHRGVDWLGTARAFVSNLRAGHQVQGGSTITQQLVKNLLVGKERSYQRKLREAVLAYRLEDELTKPQLLELYVNFVYLGSGNYGVEAAARDYFSVPAAKLDAGQAAMIAGLVPAPSRYSPRTNPAVAAQRRRLVLANLVADGHLEEEEAAAFLDDPVAIPRGDKIEGRVGVAFVTQVRRELRRVLGPERPSVAGIQVRSTMRIDVQAKAEEAIRAALEALDARQGQRGAARRIAPERYDDFFTRAPGLRRNPETLAPLPPRPGDCFEALAQKEDVVRAGPRRYTLAAERRIIRDRRGQERPLVTEPGDVLFVCAVDATTVRLDQRPWAEGAAIVIDNETQHVLALVGGYDDSLEGFVRATQARRQPGSSFKLYVYAAALLEGRTQLDLVLDAPLDLSAGGGERWRPKNFDGKFRGPMTLRAALAKSINTAAIRLLLEAGVDDVVRTAGALGVKSPLRRDPTIALGTAEVTLLDQVSAFATIARLGRPVAPVYVSALVDADDVAMAELAAFAGSTSPEVIPRGVAFELVDMLQNVVEEGTARATKRPGLARAGKTGTTNDYVDAWFVGFTPRYTVGVWIGTDGPKSLGDNETGGRAALPAWTAIVDYLQGPDAAPERFEVPDEAMLVEVDGRWVALRRGRASRKILPRPGGDAPLPLPPTPPTRTATVGRR